MNQTKFFYILTFAICLDAFIVSAQELKIKPITTDRIFQGMYSENLPKGTFQAEHSLLREKMALKFSNIYTRFNSLLLENKLRYSFTDRWEANIAHLFGAGWGSNGSGGFSNHLEPAIRYQVLSGFDNRNNIRLNAMFSFYIPASGLIGFDDLNYTLSSSIGGDFSEKFHWHGHLTFSYIRLEYIRPFVNTGLSYSPGKRLVLSAEYLGGYNQLHSVNVYNAFFHEAGFGLNVRLKSSVIFDVHYYRGVNPHYNDQPVENSRISVGLSWRGRV